MNLRLALILIAIAAPARAIDVVTIPADSAKLKDIHVAEIAAAEVPGQEVIAPGHVELLPTGTRRIALPVPGRVVELYVKLGDEVRAGQALLTVQSPDAQAAVSALNQADAALAQARSALAKAHADHDRAADLFAHGAIAKKEVVNTQVAAEQAAAGVRAAEAGRDQARYRLEFLGLKPGDYTQVVQVRSPTGGRVYSMDVGPGEYRGDTAAPVMVIADFSRVSLVAEVREQQLSQVHIGENVSVTLDAFPDETFAGRVSRIGDRIDPKTRRITVVADTDNPNGKLRPDMFGRIRHYEKSEKVPVLPPTAPLQEAGKTFVYVEIGPGQFEHREVTLGPATRAGLPARGGIAVGDRVVIEGAMLLKGEPVVEK